MPKYKSLDALQKDIEKKEVLTIPMTELRSAYGAQRLGRNIRADIANRLEELGVAHYPFELPDNQHEVIRLYKRGSLAQSVIEAVMAVTPEGDKELVNILVGSKKNGTSATKQRRPRKKVAAVADEPISHENETEEEEEESVSSEELVTV